MASCRRSVSRFFADFSLCYARNWTVNGIGKSNVVPYKLRFSLSVIRDHVMLSRGKLHESSTYISMDVKTLTLSSNARIIRISREIVNRRQVRSIFYTNVDLIKEYVTKNTSDYSRPSRFF